MKYTRWMFKGTAWNKAKGFIGFLLLLICGTCIAIAAQLDERNTPSHQISYCQTKTPVSTIEQAIHCDYDSPYRPLALSFGEATRWVRIQIFTKPENVQAFSVQVGPYFLRDIAFYKPLNNDWEIERAGSFETKNQSHSNIGGYSFTVEPKTTNQNTYYLQVEATSIARIFVLVSPLSNSSVKLSGRLLEIGVQIGILLTILVLSLISLSFNPAPAMSRFSIYIANLIVCILSGSGILALHVFKQMPVLNEMIFFIGLCLKLALWVWLAQAFLQEYKTPNWYKTVCRSIYILVGACILLGIIGNTDQSILLILIGYTVASASQIYATLKTPKIAASLRTSLILGFGSIIGLIYLAVASAFFPLEPDSQTPIYLSRLTDFVSPLVMLSIIVLQNRLARKELIRIKATLTETQLKSEFERKLLNDRKTLVDMFAHELKNPLASIGFAIANLSKSKDQENLSDQRRLENINAAIQSMDSIIERCSLINSIDQKNIPLNSKVINLGSFISNLIENTNPKQQISLRIDGEIHLYTDPQFLQIILHNLIENALKYHAPGTAIELAVNEIVNNEKSVISISISNIFEPELAPDSDMLFERFYRHPLAMKTRGSGLGLSICKELCIALGGSINFQKISNNIIFTVELPK